jgi:hypothetical protein
LRIGTSDVSDDIGLYKAVLTDQPGGGANDSTSEESDDMVKKKKDRTLPRQVSLNTKLLQGKGAEWDKQRADLLSDGSISGMRIMDMSAVGNKDHAAPEIFKTIHKYEDSQSESNLGNSSRGGVSSPMRKDSSHHTMGDSLHSGKTMSIINKTKKTKRRKVR